MNTQSIFGKLVLIGAGPGDPELLTIKAVKALKLAEIVLYDALVSTEILEYAPNSVKIFVGKRGGQDSPKQSFINNLIVKYAIEGKNVVRLKGGDPFVFGRGMEEFIYAKEHGIETQVIPGLSSSYAVPALHNIPLTHRGASESFWVVTGTTKQGLISQDIYMAVQSSATVVILMGMSKLEQIIHIYTEYGKATLPVAIIQDGSTKKEKIVKGTINTIIKKVKDNNITSPAVIILGKVVDIM